MLLTKKEIIYLTEEQSIILGHMGYAAYKLWNVANYEKRNYNALGFDNYPDWYDQKKRLKDNFFYKNLPSQTAQDVLQQLEEAWKSYFALLKTGGVKNPHPPRFKKENIGITFLKDAIQVTDNYIRLSIPKQLKSYLKTLSVNANYLYLKTKRFSNIHVKEIQLKPDGKKCTMLVVYDDCITYQLKEDNGHYLSIDLGIGNTFTCYDSDGHAFIIKGFLENTHYYDKQIAYLQGINSSQQYSKGIKYPKPSKAVLRLYQKKSNSLTDFLHKATRYITNYCVEHDIHMVIIGDLKGIRKDKNIGRMNQQLHSLPTKRIVGLLKYKLLRCGISEILQKEQYSSQCSPDSPKVSKKYATKKNRIHRGLYKNGNRIYNADAVGAYNILRLYLDGIGKTYPAHKGLSNPVKVTV